MDVSGEDDIVDYEGDVGRTEEMFISDGEFV